MIRVLLSLCLFLLFDTLGFASLNDMSQKGAGYDGKLSTFQNGVLSITVDSTPAPGLSIPKIFVLHDFIVAYEQAVNWGDTWNLTLPSGNYRIYSLPVSDGTNIYIADSHFVFVPPGITVNRLITYHVI